jgi:hypothetical protein
MFVFTCFCMGGCVILVLFLHRSVASGTISGEITVNGKEISYCMCYSTTQMRGNHCTEVLVSQSLTPEELWTLCRESWPPRTSTSAVIFWCDKIRGKIECGRLSETERKSVMYMANSNFVMIRRELAIAFFEKLIARETTLSSYLTE